MAAKDAINIGISFTRNDTDVANWFNYILEKGEQPSLYIHGLIAAKLLDETPAPIWHGETVDYSKKKKVKKNKNVKQIEKKYVYSWQKRGEYGEIIPGSTVNLTITKPEYLMYINEIRDRHMPLSIFIKELLRENFRSKEEGTATSADMQSYRNRLHMEFMSALMQRLNDGKDIGEYVSLVCDR